MSLKILSLTEWETRVAGIFSMARSCHMTHPALISYCHDHVWGEVNRKHGKRAVYSAYVKGYVSGLMRAHDADLYASYLEFCYVENGVLFSTHRGSTHRSTEEFYTAGRGSVLGTLPRGHYWKGTNKPFHAD